MTGRIRVTKERLINLILTIKTQLMFAYYKRRASLARAAGLADTLYPPEAGCDSRFFRCVSGHIYSPQKSPYRTQFQVLDLKNLSKSLRILNYNL